jgi:hypothetical protein
LEAEAREKQERARREAIERLEREKAEREKEIETKSRPNGVQKQEQIINSTNSSNSSAPKTQARPVLQRQLPNKPFNQAASPSESSRPQLRPLPQLIKQPQQSQQSHPQPQPLPQPFKQPQQSQPQPQPQPLKQPPPLVQTQLHPQNNTVPSPVLPREQHIEIQQKQFELDQKRRQEEIQERLLDSAANASVGSAPFKKKMAGMLLSPILSFLIFSR